MGLYSGPTDETVRIELGAIIRRLKDAHGICLGLTSTLEAGRLKGDLLMVMDHIDPLVVVVDNWLGKIPKPE